MSFGQSGVNDAVAAYRNDSPREVGRVLVFIRTIRVLQDVLQRIRSLPCRIRRDEASDQRGEGEERGAHVVRLSSRTESNCAALGSGERIGNNVNVDGQYVTVDVGEAQEPRSSAWPILSRWLGPCLHDEWRSSDA
jgi:hypothetical protein